MARATLRRRINKAKAQKHPFHSKPKNTQLIKNVSPTPVNFTDASGFQLVLTKKEKALMKKAQMEDDSSDVAHTVQVEDAEMTEGTVAFHETASVIYSDDGLDAQSTVSKSWVRKQLKQTHAGGISRPSCKKRQRDMFRRVLLHTHLQLHGKPNARGQAEIRTQLASEDPVSSDHPPSQTTAAENTSSSMGRMQLVNQWAEFSKPTISITGSGKKKTKKKRNMQKQTEQEKLKPVANPESVVPFRTRATATNHAIHAFQVMLQKF